MPEDMETPEVQGISNSNNELAEKLSMPQAKPKKGVNDWLRDLRMSASVNKTTLGVETERVTPELMMAAAGKLLKINRREAESDPKDSLEFQRVYGPTDYFAEHVLRDAGRLGRQLLWKATNKGNLDFMQPGALDQHVSDVFNTSKLTNMVDASSPLESVEASYKVSRLGEGGVGSVDSAPTEMRLVQPSFLGYIDPVRSVECGSEKHMVFTTVGWKKIADVTTDDMVACLVGGRLEYHHPEQVVSYEYDGELYCFDNGTMAYEVTGNHRMWCRKQPHKERMTKRGWKKAYEPQFEFEYAENMHNTNRIVQTGGHLPLVHGKKTCMIVTSDEDACLFDMKDWCAFLGWYVAEGCIVHTDKYRRAVNISQSTHTNPENCGEIAELLHRMCIHYSRTDTGFWMRSRTLYNELEPLGYCDDKYIPEEVFEAPEEAQWAFIDALLKGDGEKQKTGLPILHTTSKRLADDYERLMFQLGYAVSRSNRPDNRQPQYKHMYRVRVLQTTQAWLYKNGHKITEREELSEYYYKEPYKGKVYCLTVPGGLFYTKLEGRHGFWTGNSLRVGLDAYMTKNCMKGSDGKLYQKFIDAKTGKEVLLDSVTAAKSVITTPEMMQAKTNHVYAMGGKTGVRIVKKSDVDYYLPHMDDAFTNAANLVTGLSGVKELRLLMGCLHPLMNVVCVNKRNETSIIPAKLVSTEAAEIVPGATDKGKALNYHVRTTVAKLPGGRNWFRKVVLYSGRTLVTSKDHRWPVIRDGEVVLVPAEKLRKGDKVPRSTFKDFPNRRMFINKQLVTRDVAVLLGYAARTLQQSDGKLVITYQPRHEQRIRKALDKLQVANDAHFYKTTNFRECLAFREGWFREWLEKHIGVREDERAIPSEVLSADLPTVICFLDAYTADETQVAMDSAECMWILNLPNTQVRDSIAFLLARTRTDTYYRDSYQGGGEWQLALKLVEMKTKWNDCILDEVKAVLVAPNAPIMVDIDVNDNLYATANGIITHNSKYPQQAVSIESREAPYVRNIDEQSGLDMHSRIGKYLGARYARKPGTVTAVRKDRIDMLYDDGTKGSVELYENFPMNAKGYITNTPQVKAGQHVDANGLLASSNYTDDKGAAALGTNLRTGWMSWKGGTYEDAIVISESAAKKLTSTTMYSNDLDLDKTVTLGKNNYIAWKPSEYTKDQMAILDDDGIVRPGSIVRKGDPLVLAVRTSEPSPGTMGKRILTDLSQTWEHDHPGRITDIVRTRKGVRVLATVTAPMEVGDKLSGGFGNKGVVSQVIPDDQMPVDKDGKPLEVLMSPLGLITRCYDDQTEFFTDSGWKLGRDVLDTDVLCCYNPATDGTEWLMQLEPMYVKEYKGDMFAVSNDMVDFCVTPGHKVWARLEYDFKEMRVDDIYGKNCLLPSAEPNVRLCVWAHDWIVKKYEGIVYCPTVPTGYVVTRRNSGKPICLGNTNPAQLTETLLGKVAHKTGKTQTIPAFYNGNMHDYVMDKLKQAHLNAEDDFFDPETGRKIPDVVNGYSYMYKLKHLAESKEAARGTDEYGLDETPAGGGYSGSKRFGTLEIGAMTSHNAFENLLDAKLIRGQNNSDFWRSVRTGGIPTIPGEPLVQKKFFAHLQGAGVNIRKTPKGVSIFALSNKDVSELAGPREVKSRDTYEAKTFRPIDGGLFGQDVFGPNGDKWAYIQLDEPVPNPVMAEPLARLLRMTDKDFVACATGEKEVNGIKGPEQLKKHLSQLDVADEARIAMNEFKNAPASKKDAALKRYVAIENMRRQGVQPSEYMLDKIPVLPPVFRPISSHNGLTMVADANYLYAQLLDARDDLREAKSLPQEYQDKARLNIYKKWNELTGMYDPEDVKLKNKNVGGLLQWALGKGSPKFSAIQRKVIGMSVDTVGRGVAVPDSRLTIDELGIPVEMALDVMAPFVERKLVNMGYTPIDAMKMVKKRDRTVMSVLDEVVKTHPVEMNRAPTLHKFNIMAFKPVLVQGHAIHANPAICPGYNLDFDGNCVDYDSEIFLRISKSKLDNTSFMCYISSVAQKGREINPYNNGGNKMRVSAESLVTAHVEDVKLGYIYVQMKIGEFPKTGEPVKDRNGADVYCVPSGVEVLGCDPVTGRPGWYEVSAFTHERNCRTVKVIAGNREVIVSNNASLAVFDPPTGKLTKVQPLKSERRFIPVFKKDPRPFGDFGDRDLGWLFGAWLSDGWCVANAVGYCKQEKAKRDEFVRIMRDCHDNFTLHEYAEEGKGNKSKLGDSVKIHMNSKSLAEWWAQWRFIDEDELKATGRKALAKKLDADMLTFGSEEFLWGLFSGLIDGDGSVVKNMATGKPRFNMRFSTSSVKLKDGICQLCYRLGIRYSVSVTPPRNFSNTAYVVMPSTTDIYKNLDKLTLIGARERALLAEWRQSVPSFDKADMIPLSDDEAMMLGRISSAVHNADIYNALHRNAHAVKYVARTTLQMHMEDIEDMAPALAERVKNTDTLWYQISSVEDAGDRDVFDLEVDDAKVYAVNNGVIVWDTVNIHVPVSDAARKEAMDRMRPSRNLMSPASRKIMNKPEKEYMQGLYIATRMGEAPNGRAQIFRTYEEARDAYRQGLIDVDTPIQILENKQQ